MKSEKEGEIVYGSESDSEAASQLMMRRRHGTDDDEDDEPSDVVTLQEAQRDSIGSQRNEPRRKNPTSDLRRGKYYMHDDRGGGQRWYRSGKSSAPKDDEKWKHDKYEELQQGWVPKNRRQGHYKHQGRDHGHVRGRGPVRYRPITGTRNGGPTIQENQSRFSSSTPIEKTSKNQLVQTVQPKNKNAEVSSSTGPARRFWSNPSKKNASPASQMSYPTNHQPKNDIRSSMYSWMSNSPSASAAPGHSHNHPSTAGDSHSARQFSSLSPTSAEATSNTGPVNRYCPNLSKKITSPASQMPYPSIHQPENVIRSPMSSWVSVSPTASGAAGHSHHHPSTAGDLNESHLARRFSSLSLTSEGSSHKHVHGKNPVARKGFRGPPPQ